MNTMENNKEKPKYHYGNDMMEGEWDDKMQGIVKEKEDINVTFLRPNTFQNLLNRRRISLCTI
jgi:hypothetical protein